MTTQKRSNADNAPANRVPYAKVGAWIDQLEMGESISLDDSIVQSLIGADSLDEVRKALEFFAELDFIKWNSEKNTVELCARDNSPVEPFRQKL